MTIKTIKKEIEYENRKVIYYENEKRQRHGKCQVFENCLLTEEREYRKGVLLSKKTFFDNGQIKVSEKYKNNKLTDELIAYYEDGTIDFKLNYVKGILEGKQIWYHKNGNIKREEMRIKGLIEGTVKTYYDSGELYMTVKYREGEQYGFFKYFNKDGTLKYKTK